MLRAVILAVLIAGGISGGAATACADDPDFLSFGGGWFDIVNRDDDAGEARVEYRSDYRFWLLKPFGGVMVNTDGGVHAYAGILSDFYFGRRIVISPSVAPGYYHKGDGKDLGHELEIRSQLEVAYRLDDRSRVGVAFSHMSNAGLGDRNPGSESLTVYYSIPVH